jgi:hypothetical protein
MSSNYQEDSRRRSVMLIIMENVSFCIHPCRKYLGTISMEGCMNIKLNFWIDVATFVGFMIAMEASDGVRFWELPGARSCLLLVFCCQHRKKSRI